MNRREFIRKTISGCVGVSAGITGFPSVIHAKTTLRAGYIPILDHAVLMVSHANDNNHFKKTDVIPKLFKFWRSMAGALRAGKIDAAFLLCPFAMDMFHKGAGIKSVLTAHRNGSAITVGNNTKISSPRDLAGKRIAVPARISIHSAMLDRYLRQEGLSLKDVETRVIAPSNMIRALQAEYIDAFIVAEPFCAKAENTGIGRTLIFSNKIFPDHICCVVAVRNEVLRENPEGIREWIGSLKQNGKFIDEDRVNNGAVKSAEIIAKYTRHKTQDIISGMTGANDRITYSNLNPTIDDYRKILDISQQTGILGDVSLNEFIDDSFSKKIS